MRAADLFDQGAIPTEIARQVGVSHQIVSPSSILSRQFHFLVRSEQRMLRDLT